MSPFGRCRCQLSVKEKSDVQIPPTKKHDFYSNPLKFSTKFYQIFIHKLLNEMFLIDVQNIFPATVSNLTFKLKIKIQISFQM